MSSKYLLIGVLIGSILGVSTGFIVTQHSQNELRLQVHELKNRLTDLENNVEIIFSEEEELYLDDDDLTWEIVELGERQKGIEREFNLLKSDIASFSDLVFEILFNEASLEELLTNLDEYQVTEN